MKALTYNFPNTIGRAAAGLKTPLALPKLIEPRVFAAAQAKGVDLNDTTTMFKRDGFVYSIEIFQDAVFILPYLKLKTYEN